MGITVVVIWCVFYRTKLKQTEVDCEYLKRCCETLTEENRRLQKELAELRALKTAHPFYMHLPATTLSMCPSCERVASSATSSSSVVGAVSNTASTSAAAATASDHRPNSFAALFNRPRSGYPFAGPPQKPPTSSWGELAWSGSVNNLISLFVLLLGFGQMGYCEHFAFIFFLFFWVLFVHF